MKVQGTEGVIHRGASTEVGDEVALAHPALFILKPRKYEQQPHRHCVTVILQDDKPDHLRQIRMIPSFSSDTPP